MTVAAARVRRSALWHRFHQAIANNTSNLARTDAVVHVRDVELDRLLNQVADYERQIQQLAGEKDQAVRELERALAEITRLNQPADVTEGN
jgi:chromosome segregation ATPase